MSLGLGAKKGDTTTFTRKARFGRTLKIKLTRLQEGKNGDCSIVVTHKDLQSKEIVSKKCADSDVDEEIHAILRKRNNNLLMGAAAVTLLSGGGAFAYNRRRSQIEAQKAQEALDQTAIPDSNISRIFAQHGEKYGLEFKPYGDEIPLQVIHYTVMLSEEEDQFLRDLRENVKVQDQKNASVYDITPNALIQKLKDSGFTVTVTTTTQASGCVATSCSLRALREAA